MSHEDDDYLSEDIGGPDPYPPRNDPYDQDRRDDDPGAYPEPEAGPPAANRPVEFAEIRCTQCGYNLTGVSIGGACPECGSRVDQSFQAATSHKANGKAVASMVLGICALVLCCCPGPVLAILGLIFGNIALGEIKTGNYTPGSRGMAVAGIWCSAISLVLTAFYWLLSFVGSF